ncbi:hypothetical protein T265_10455 [Opisthorchis viverrini]|uniref:Uncharacterized protein n=1 Tax=Opisthorchis viverrini TaxID=6198 RepID=A0A075A1C4_OPIVI|nr:hypothetical protein T265_10455 [Opisthorchis viverrini]KER21159.1 hypothetical protein T265_10455 [Opisthorchis viverrini]
MKARKTKFRMNSQKKSGSSQHDCTRELVKRRPGIALGSDTDTIFGYMAVRDATVRGNSHYTELASEDYIHRQKAQRRSSTSACA